MVAAALVAGLIGGFIIPDRPRSMPSAVETQVASTDKADKKSRAETTATVPSAQSSKPVRSHDNADSAGQSQAPTRDRNSCAIETWPYRTPNCLDRTATVEPTHTVVNARRIDPSVNLVKGEEKSTEATAKSRQKIVSAPPARDEAANAKNATPANHAPSEKSLEPTAEPAPVRRPARRASDLSLNPEWRGAPRTYIRGPDGRLYLAPEYRPAPTRYYYIR
jgi:hypothetical protein